jgi:DNA replication and repair protein RecF
VLVVGPNGAGKSNLLEALHVGTQGLSPRTRSDAQLVRFGTAAARVTVRGTRAATPVEISVVIRASEGKQAWLNGDRVTAIERLRAEAAALVFTPDRLAVAKAGPATRRAYFDRVLTRLFPARALLPLEYGRVLGQRNVALRRAAAGVSSASALEPWTAQLVALGAELVAARLEALALLSPCFGARAEELGLSGALLVYEGEAPSLDQLTGRLEKDLERGATGAGPHLHDVRITVADRDVRTYGSQGEQRIVVLSLLLAEADVLTERRGTPPLLLLDDVLSELDPERRRILAGHVAARGQTLVATTSRAALPRDPDQALEVSSGSVREV